MTFTQILANSLVIGSIYALVACGFSLVYSTNKFMHFAHGVAVVVSSYLLYWTFSMLGMPFVISCLLTLTLTSIFGLLMSRLIYRPLQQRKSSNVILLIASVGLLVLFENLILIAFGPNIKTLEFVRPLAITIFGATVTVLQIIIFIVSVVLFILLYLLMKKTKLGRNFRAVADNKELADITGIDSKKIADYSFILGSFLAGVAGILIALEQTLMTAMGTNLIIKGFTGAIIGGIGFVPGSIIGSYILGLAENFGIWFLPSGFKDAITFILLFLFLLLRPQGLFGVDKGARK
ncbi:MAG: branched-chain amino acid ABC transporter permease [archaeon]